MLRKAPLVAEWVGDFSVAVTPELVCKRHIDLGARGDSTVEGGINIFSVEDDINGVGGTGRRRTGHAGKLVTNENNGVADSDLAVHDPAVRPGHAHDFGCAKDGLVKINGACCTFAGQRWRNGMIPLGDSTDRIWHDCLLGRLDVRALETGEENGSALRVRELILLGDAGVN